MLQRTFWLLGVRGRLFLVVWPRMPTGMAFPTFLGYGDRQVEEKACITSPFVQTVEGYVHGITLRAAGLHIFARSFHLKLFWRCFVEQLCRGLGIFWPHKKFDATYKVGVEPIKPYDIVVHKSALDARGIKNTLRDRSFRQITVTAYYDRRLRLASRFAFASFHDSNNTRECRPGRISREERDGADVNVAVRRNLA